MTLCTVKHDYFSRTARKTVYTELGGKKGGSKMRSAFNNWTEKLGYIVGKAFGMTESIVSSFKYRGLDDEDYLILCSFVMEQLPRYLNGKRLLPSTKYKVSIGSGGALLEMRRSKMTWHMDLKCRVFHNQREAAWAILGHSAGSDAILPLIDKDDGSVMRQDQFYLCKTAEGITYVMVDKDRMLWREAGKNLYRMPQTASMGFKLSDLKAGECIAYPADRRLVKRDHGALWTSDDPFGAGYWELLDE